LYHNSSDHKETLLASMMNSTTAQPTSISTVLHQKQTEIAPFEKPEIDQSLAAGISNGF